MGVRYVHLEIAYDVKLEVFSNISHSFFKIIPSSSYNQQLSSHCSLFVLPEVFWCWEGIGKDSSGME